MKNKIVSIICFVLAIFLSGCSLATGIFKAGAWTGVIIVVLIVAAIVGLILSLGKK